MSTIMVQVDHHSDTLAALHAACTLAQVGRDDVALVYLVPVNHPALLGTEWGGLNFRDKDWRRLQQCLKLAKSYGVDVTTCTVQTISTVGGIIHAAGQVNAHVVFAHLPHAFFPLWSRWQTALLRRRLGQQHCQLYLFDKSDRTATITYHPSMAHN